MKFHQVFREAVKAAVAYKQNTTDFLDQVMQELEVGCGEQCRSGDNAGLNCACTTCIRVPWGPLVVALLRSNSEQLSPPTRAPCYVMCIRFLHLASTQALVSECHC